MRTLVRILRVLILAIAVGGSAYVARQTPNPRPQLAERTGSPLSEAQNWGYQLQRARPNLISANVDMVVLDYARDGRDETAWRPADVEAFRQRPDGKKRIVLAYMSIGEAENYRFYWQRQWSLSSGVPGIRPNWLSDENPEWKGNYRVRFWDPDWQKLLAAPGRTLLDQILEAVMPWRKPYLDRILEAGFDGVYLDRTDAFQDWSKTRTSAENEMVAFVARLSRYAKSRRPGFLVVPQNAEELLRRTEYRRLIDGIAKEDLFYGIDGDGKENAPAEVNRSILLLNRATADGLPVFVVEYVNDRSKQAALVARAQALGFVIHFAPRELNHAPTVTDRAPAPPQSK